MSKLTKQNRNQTRTKATFEVIFSRFTSSSKSNIQSLNTKKPLWSDRRLRYQVSGLHV